VESESDFVETPKIILKEEKKLAAAAPPSPKVEVHNHCSCGKVYSPNYPTNFAHLQHINNQNEGRLSIY
jgi:hypothetical protein